MRLLFILKKNPLLILGLLMSLFLLFIAFFGKYLPFVDEELREIEYLWNKDKVPVPPPYAPSDEHRLGTDRNGRDILSLLVMGTRQTLLLVVLITLIRYVCALALSFLAHKRIMGAGKFVNWLNGLLSYIPTIIIIILFATLPPIYPEALRPFYLLLVIALVEVGRVSKMLQTEMDEISKKEFITGGIAVGLSPFRLFRYYYLPYLYDKLLVNMVTDTARVMFVLGQLALIGIYISQKLVYIDSNWQFVNDSTIWPTLLIEAFRDIRSSTWIPFYSVLTMTYTIFSFNILAQGLQKLFKSKVDHF